MNDHVTEARRFGPVHTKHHGSSFRRKMLHRLSYIQLTLGIIQLPLLPNKVGLCFLRLG
jgi:hypothetical protein